MHDIQIGMLSFSISLVLHLRIDRIEVNNLISMMEFLLTRVKKIFETVPIY